MLNYIHRGNVMIARKAEHRGHFDHGWLNTYHTFSFAAYYDPKHMGFRALRVINDDRILPGTGFGTHGHDNMEIITYMLEGSLQHRDSMGFTEIIHAGQTQQMTAGTGIHHSEANPSDTETTHLLQIWILPDKKNHTPKYETKEFAIERKRGKLALIASPDGRDDSLTIHQNALLYATVLDPGVEVTYDLKPDRHAWVHVATGEALVNGETARGGDAFALSGAHIITLAGVSETEILVFDLA